MPYVVASQTIPIIALAPMIVFALGANVTSVVVIATYLTFFPVTIAMLRGLRSFDPRALELMRSYAASRSQVYWKLRLPASLPYLFVGPEIAATASIVGAIIGEGPGGINDGLGRVILTFNQYYITGPEKLWATISRRASSASSSTCSSASRALRPARADPAPSDDRPTGGPPALTESDREARRRAGRGRQDFGASDQEIDGRPPGHRPDDRARASSCRSSGRPAAASPRCCGSSRT